MRWILTVVIGALCLLASVVRYAPPGAPHVDFARRMGQVVGYAISPWIIGRYRPGDITAFHRRLNWAALIILVLSTVGWIGQLAQQVAK